MKISQFPSGGAALGTDLVPIVRNGQDFTVTASALLFPTPVNIPYTGALNPTGNRIYAGASDITNSYIFQAGASIAGVASNAADGVISPYHLNIAGDTVDVTTNGASLLRMFSATLGVSAGHTGGRTAVYGQVSVVGAASVTPTGAGYVGGEFFGFASANNGGAAGAIGNYKGGLYGWNPTARLGPNATFWAVCNGGEINVGIQAGGSVASKYGITIIKQTIDRVQGTYDDCAIEIVDQGAFGLIPPWNFGISFGGYSSQYPFDGTSTLIGGQQRQAGLPADITAGSFIVNKGFKIHTVGTTDYTLIGSPNNTVGTVFIATGVGAGTGTATPDQSCANIGIDFSSVLFKTAALKSTGFSVGPFGNIVGGSNPNAAGFGLQITGTFTGSNNYIAQFSDVNNTNGAGIRLTGNGGVTPTKVIRAASGNLDILNDAVGVIARFGDAGNLQLTGALGANGVTPPARVTGWGVPSNAGVLNNFTGSAATLAQTGQVVAQLIIDLKAIGFYAA